MCHADLQAYSYEPSIMRMFNITGCCVGALYHSYIIYLSSVYPACQPAFLCVCLMWMMIWWYNNCVQPYQGRGHNKHKNISTAKPEGVTKGAITVIMLVKTHLTRFLPLIHSLTRTLTPMRWPDLREQLGVWWHFHMWRAGGGDPTINERKRRVVNRYT